MARRPSLFHKVIGQRAKIAHIRRLIAGARQLGQPCPSHLLLAPPGSGKSLLAEAIAAEYGTRLARLVAGPDVTPRTLVDTLAALNAHDILFIDEAHALKQEIQEVLFLALDKQKTFRPTPAGLDRTDFQSLPPFTLLMATDQPGRLRRALVSRLSRLEFDPYSPTELKEIAERVAARQGAELTPQAARLLTELPCCTTPRRVQQFVDQLKKYFPTEPRFTQPHVAAFLRGAGIDCRGCSSLQRDYLNILASAEEGCSLMRLKVKLGVDLKFIQEDVEPLLFELAVVEVRADRRRELTAEGRRVAAQEFGVQTEEDNDKAHEREAG